VLYVQIAGRGLRTAPGKTDTLWLDFTDTTATLGPVDAVKGRSRPPAREGAEFKAPVKHCDECGNPNPTAVLACTHCGHLFPEPERVRHEARADTTAAVLSGGPSWYSITRVDYARHEGREGKPDTLRVDYWSAWRRVASEWVCLEHIGYARMKASRWWMERSEFAAPETIDEALDRTAELREPGRIAVQMDGKYPRVVSAHFANQAEAA
jgi:DNA repair protein RadD